MKISLWKERDYTRQAYLQLTQQEAKRLIDFLQEQLGLSGAKSLTEKSVFEEYLRKNSPVPDSERGLITYAIVDQEDTDSRSIT